MKAYSLIVLFFIFYLCQSCFITNCPRGGKRSLGYQTSIEMGKMRQCMRCGPEGLGRCFAPDLCCGPDVGCFKGTQETAACRREILKTTPCKNKALSCKAVKHGQCVTEGYCCNDEGNCKNDVTCRDILESQIPNELYALRKLFYSDFLNVRK